MAAEIPRRTVTLYRSACADPSMSGLTPYVENLFALKLAPSRCVCSSFPLADFLRCFSFIPQLPGSANASTTRDSARGNRRLSLRLLCTSLRGKISLASPNFLLCLQPPWVASSRLEKPDMERGRRYQNRTAHIEKRHHYPKRSLMECDHVAVAGPNLAIERRKYLGRDGSNSLLPLYRREKTGEDDELDFAVWT